MFGMIADVKELSNKMISQKDFNSLSAIDKNVRDSELKISSFKENMKNELKELENQEKQIENSIKALKNEIFLDQKDYLFEIQNESEQALNLSPVDTAEDQNADKNEEIDSLEAIRLQIAAIDEQIEKNGGRDCGWLKIDHEDFVKIFVKKGKNPKSKAFKESLYKNFPLFSVESINSHIEKFILNEQLNFEKKELLSRFKRFQHQKANVELEKFYEFEQNENQNKENKHLNAILIKEREKRTKELDNWRSEKEKQEKELLINKRKEEQKKREIFELTKIKEDVEKKEKLELLQKYKEQKHLRRLMSAEQRNYEKRMKIVPLKTEDLIRIKEKEEQILKKKEELIAKKEKQKIEKQERLDKFFNKIDQKFDYVENNVTHITVAHIQKQSKKFDFNKDKGKFGDNFGGSLIRTEGRKIVEWRQV